MGDYAWVCHSCKAVNAPGELACRACGFPAVATGAQIEEAVTGIKQPPRLNRKELQRQRRAELAGLPLHKKPFAYFLRVVQFIGGVILWIGIFNLAAGEVLMGIALAVVAELMYQLLKGKSDGQPSISQEHAPSCTHSNCV